MLTVGLLGFALAAQSKFEYGKIVEVLDSNRLRVSISGRLQTVRLLGTKAASIEHDQNSQCCSREAIAFLNRILLNTTLVFEADQSIGDGNETQELLRYVYVQPGNRDLNAELVRSGLAVVQRDLEFRRRKEFLSLEKGARDLGIGLWSACTDESMITSSQLAERKLREETTNALRAPVSTRRGRCCTVCSKGKACGDSCISRSSTCRQPSGCACDG